MSHSLFTLFLNIPVSLLLFAISTPLKVDGSPMLPPTTRPMNVESKLESLQWEVTRHSTSTKAWCELLMCVAAASYTDEASRATAVTIVQERAVRAIPYSYKLWHRYLTYRIAETRSLCSMNEWFQSVRGLFERAVEHLPQMPRLWVSYLEFVMGHRIPHVTMVRHLIGRSLAALPATQHHLIWKQAKAWSARSVVPAETFQVIWSLYLLFDTSAEARTQYLTCLLQRGDRQQFVSNCVELAVRGADKATAAHTALIEDMAFWEPIRLLFQTPGWTYNGPIPELTALVEVGCKYCASPNALQVSFGSFLYGQGHIAEGRAVFLRLLQQAPNPETFALVYPLAVEAEDQLVESFALSPGVQQMEQHTYQRVVQRIFGSERPVAQLDYLVLCYPMLFNQAQLRAKPRSVPLWLKRSELLLEDIFAGRAEPNDLIALYRQAIDQCTAGMDTVDIAVAQLYESLAVYLLDSDRVEEAMDLLSTAAFSIAFTSSAGNAILAGILLEVKLVHSGNLVDTIRYALQFLGAATPLLARQGRRGIITHRSALPSVQKDARIWTLLADLCVTCRDATQLQLVGRLFASSSAFTTEGALYIAQLLFQHGLDKEAVQYLEGASVICSGSHHATVLLLDQFLSCLVLTHGNGLPLHLFRDLCRFAEEASAAAMPTTPIAALELLLSCSLVESRVGLYGNAVRLIQNGAERIIRCVDEEKHLAVAQCMTYRAILSTHVYRGLPETRRFCQHLLRAVSSGPLVFRIAVCWASIEKRSGFPLQAKTILDACGDSQDPGTTHGAEYWKAWESLCSNMHEFEDLARRKQQVRVRFAK